MKKEQNKTSRRVKFGNALERTRTESMHTQRASNKVLPLLLLQTTKQTSQESLRTRQNVRSDFSALLHHAHAQLRALGIGQLLETDGGSQALLRKGGEGGEEDDVALSPRVAPDNQSLREDDRPIASPPHAQSTSHSYATLSLPPPKCIYRWPGAHSNDIVLHHVPLRRSLLRDRRGGKASRARLAPCRGVAAGAAPAPGGAAGGAAGAVGQKGESVEVAWVVASAAAEPHPLDLPETPVTAGAGPKSWPCGQGTSQGQHATC
jgi:hypothetical protein